MSGRCSCPYGADGVFCKHCVAAPLARPRRSRRGAGPGAVG
ncbi:SWIM zinc finger family protein [Solihabitans fulvus]